MVGLMLPLKLIILTLGLINNIILLFHTLTEYSLSEKYVNLYNFSVVWSYTCVYRECNKKANALAKATRKQNLYGELWSNLPEMLHSHILHMM